MEDPERTGRGLPDATLLARYVRRGDAESFAELVRRLTPLVWGVARQQTARREDAEDVLQVAFAELARRAGTIAEPAALAGWMHTVTVRAAGHLRKRAAATAALEAEPADPASLRSLGQRAALDALTEELEALPDGWREPLLLRYHGGLSNAEAAERMGLSQTAFEGRLKRGKGALRVRLLKRGFGVTAVLACVRNGAGSPPEPAAVADAAWPFAADPELVALPRPLATPAAGGSLTAWKLGGAAVAAACLIAALSGEGQSPAARPLQVLNTAAADPPAEAAVEVPPPANTAPEPPADLPPTGVTSEGWYLQQFEAEVTGGSREAVEAEVALYRTAVEQLNAELAATVSPAFRFREVHDGVVRIAVRDHPGIMVALLARLESLELNGERLDTSGIDPDAALAHVREAGNFEDGVVIPPELMPYVLEMTAGHIARLQGAKPTGVVLTNPPDPSTADRAESRVVSFGASFWEFAEEDAETYWNGILAPLNETFGADTYELAGFNEHGDADIRVTGSSRTDLPLVVRVNARNHADRRAVRRRVEDGYNASYEVLLRTATDIPDDERPFLAELEELIRLTEGEANAPTVTFDFDNRDFAAAAKSLGRDAGVPVRVDTDGVSTDRVTLKGEMSFEDALRRLVIGNADGLDYVRGDDGVLVTTTEKAGRILRSEVYDVPPGLDGLQVDALVRTHAVSSRRGPVHWFGDQVPHAAGTATRLGDRLLVTQSDRGHEAVRAVLQTLRESAAAEHQ